MSCSAFLEGLFLTFLTNIFSGVFSILSHSFLKISQTFVHFLQSNTYFLMLFPHQIQKYP